MNDSVRNHIKCIMKVVYCYLLGIVLGWAGYPVMMFLVSFFSINTMLTVYSVFVTVISAVVLYVAMHEMGENDRRPYKWSKYKGKGFVCSTVGAVIVTLIGFFVIFIANKAAYVQHPYFNIANINSYIKMIVYIPFFWFFELVKQGNRLIPDVTYLSALVIVPFLSVVGGFGYLAGFMNVNIIKKEDGSDIVSKILYKDE